MKVVVAVKRIGRLGPSVRMTPDGWGVEPDDLTFDLNPADRAAVRMAARLVAEAGEGEVVAINAGDDDNDEALRAAALEGATRLVRVWDEALFVADALCTARSLTPAIAREKPDVVVFGAASEDMHNAATGPAAAHFLDLPTVTEVSDARLGAADTLVVTRAVDGLAEDVMVSRPVLLTTIADADADVVVETSSGGGGSVDLDVQVVSFPELGIDQELVDAAAGGWLRSIALRDEIEAPRPDAAEVDSSAGDDRIVVIPDVVDGRLDERGTGLLRAAAALQRLTGWRVHVAVLAPDGLVADELAGADEVSVVTTGSQTFDIDVDRAALRASGAMSGARAYLVADSPRGRALGPAVAAAEGLGLVSRVERVDVVDGVLVASRGIYDGRVVIEIEMSEKPAAVLVMSGTDEPLVHEPLDHVAPVDRTEAALPSPTVIPLPR